MISRRPQVVILQLTKMNIELMRHHNSVSVLGIIRDLGPVSRTQIADCMNLSRPSVSEIVATLLEEGWIQEIGTVKGGRGRRPVYLTVNPEGRYAIGVQIGAFEITIVLCDLAGEIRTRSSFRVREGESPQEVLEKICVSVSAVVASSNIPRGRILGVGVAVHGIVQPTSGVSIYAPILGWRDIEVGGYIEERTGFTTLVENDCNSSALGELWYGHGKGEANFITVLSDYGIGSGIIANGQLYRGVNHVEGQIGHITVDEEGPRCACGNYGCLDVVASEPAVVRRLQKRLRQGDKSILQDMTGNQIESIRIFQVYLAARAGDRLVRETLLEVGRYLGIGFSALINLFNPRFLILGGGMSEVADLVIPAIQDVVAKRTLGDEAKQTPIMASRLKKDLYPIGAATLVMAQGFGQPLPGMRKTGAVTTPGSP